MKKKEVRNENISGNGGGDTRDRARQLLNEGAELLRQRRPVEAADQLEPNVERNSDKMKKQRIAIGRYSSALKGLRIAVWSLGVL